MKMQCELCGRKEAEFSALIEGVELQVCESCAKHGQILKKPVFAEKARKPAEEEPETVVVDNFAELVKRKRESMGLNQEDFSRSVNIKHSLFQNIESGHTKPTLDVAKKLEKIIGMRLTKELKPEKISLGKKSESSFTIGDLIKLKK